MNLHCDGDSFSREKLKYTNYDEFRRENSYTFDTDELYLRMIGSPEFFEYLNMNYIVSLIYEFSLMSSSNNC